MTSPQPPHAPAADAPGPGTCPYTGAGAPPAAPGPALLPLYGPEFSANPHPTFEALRRMGPIAPVEINPGITGYVTTTYQAALHLLRNTPDLFSKDPRNWIALSTGQVDPDAPALGMMRFRDNALWLDGIPHSRLRKSITDSLRLVDTHHLVRSVTDTADDLIDQFAADGTGDLVPDLADPLPLKVLIEMFGSPPDIAGRIVSGVMSLYAAQGDPVRANAEMEDACLELVRLKRDHPGSDVVSWLVDHPAALSDTELVQQLVLGLGAGGPPCTNLISNALRLIIEDTRSTGSLYDGSLSVGEAMDEVLWNDPPVANYSPMYARSHHTYQGVAVEPGVPILVSFAAANSDPALAPSRHRRAGNRAHLAFSAGVHGCPASGLARVITETAVERVLDRLPDLQLACAPEELVRRPGPFQGGWATLPVVFQPVQVERSSPGQAAWNTSR